MKWTCRKCGLDLGAESFSPSEHYRARPMCRTCRRIPRAEDEDPEERNVRLSGELIGWALAVEQRFLLEEKRD